MDIWGFFRKERIKLFNQHIGALFKFGAIGLGPPIQHVAIAIEFRTLVIKAMADFMADNCPNTAVIGCDIGIQIKERWLQDGGRKDDLILDRVVISVNSLRGHQPFGLINWLADLGEFDIAGKFGDATNIFKEAISLNG